MWEAVADFVDGIYHRLGGAAGGGGQTAAPHSDADRCGVVRSDCGRTDPGRRARPLFMGRLSRVVRSAGSDKGRSHHWHVDVGVGGGIDMDGDAPRPLNTEEAKARLRAAARGLSLGPWVRQHSWRVLGLSLVGGFVVGRIRISALTRTMMMQRIVPLLLTVLVGRSK